MLCVNGLVEEMETPVVVPAAVEEKKPLAAPASKYFSIFVCKTLCW